MSDEIIMTEGLSFLYAGNDRLSLDGVDIRIRPGVKTAILGANGAGKSTLFYHFNGVFEPSEGTVYFDGQPISYRKKALKALRSRVSVVLQNPDDQIFGQTVEDDIAYGPRNMKLPEEEVSARVEEAIGLVGLENLRGRNTLQLSYGQRKRLALAGALAMRPEVLIMDEPTAGLDPQMALELMELAEQLHHNGTTVVISTHDIDLAYAWADEIHVLRKGKLIYSGDPEVFYSDASIVYLTGIMQPSMFLINKSMCDMRGVPEAPYPRTETQLVSKMASGDKGKLIVMPVDDVLDKYMMDAATDGLSEDMVTGIFGYHTRGMLGDSMLPIDYVFEGFEACMSDCLMGKDAVLFCDRDCVDLIESKVRLLEDYGTVVEMKVLEGPRGTPAD
ncbi:MAG: energy-coupling factor ABC transporter ATP-binding protein [Candidatus Methanomethylophilaceae archaeon]